MYIWKINLIFIYLLTTRHPLGISCLFYYLFFVKPIRLIHLHKKLLRNWNLYDLDLISKVLVKIHHWSINSSADKKDKFLFQNLRTMTFHSFLYYQLKKLSRLFLHTNFHTQFTKFLVHLVLFFLLQKFVNFILRKKCHDQLTRFVFYQCL